MTVMKEEEFYYLQEQERIEKIKETPQEHLTRLCYIRNFDPPKIKNIKQNEVDILRSPLENAGERT